MTTSALSAGSQADAWGGRIRDPVDIPSVSTSSTTRCVTERVEPRGERRIPILAPEHLLARNALFDRPKDWLDIEQILLTVDDLDASDALRWVERGAGEDDDRLAKLRGLIQRDLEPQG